MKPAPSNPLAETEPNRVVQRSRSRPSVSDALSKER
jgi:hypothetical protein